MINIAFASSFSSQIGLLALLNTSDLVIDCLILIPSNEHKNNQFLVSIFEEEKRIKKRVLVKTSFFKLLIIVGVDFLKILSKFKLVRIAILSPRPFWLFSILGPVRYADIFSALFTKFDNNNCVNYYYGDGLSCFCFESKPFWLKVGNNSLTPSRGENRNSRYFYYYHMFESDFIFKSVCLENELSVTRLRQNILHESIDSALNVINYQFDFLHFLSSGVHDIILSNRKLLIFTTTTFSKTNRCSFDDELNLYIRYFIENITDDDSFLLFKFHPSAGEKMNSMLFKFLIKKYSKRILFLDPFISAVPIEVILKFIIKNNIFLETNITLFACSSGTAMPKSLFTGIRLTISFGRSYLCNVLNERALEKRLRQEEILENRFLYEFIPYDSRSTNF